MFDPRDWYWIVAGDETRRWSSADRAYVQPDDAAYLAFVEGGALPTRILNEAELWDVLREQAPGRLPDSEQPRRAIRKLLVTDRLIAAGLAEAVLAGFGQMPLAKLRWDSAIDLWADDADVIAFLTAIGADPEAILAPE